MTSGIKIKLFSKNDIVDTKGVDISTILTTIEDALLDYKKGNTLLPDKISQTFDEVTQNRINCMPATLINKSICGVKWVSVFPNNPKEYNIPNISGVIVLSELKKGFPFAIMDGTYITAIRTACVGAVASKYLARNNSYVYGSIGAGEQAKMHFIAIKQVHPEIKVCYIASRTTVSEVRLKKELEELYPDVKFICCESNYDKAVVDADIIVTAVSSQVPLLKANVIKKGAFYCHVGGREDEDAVPLMAQKIVCDNWNSLKHRSTPTISRLYSQGKLKDDDIYCDLVDIIDGEKKGRENEDEFIYFNSIGLGFIDMAVANVYYESAIKQGKGIDWIINEF